MTEVAGLLINNEGSAAVNPCTSLNKAALPTASIIIVSYNSLPYLAECLDSVLETTPSQTEIIVVDNASTDGSSEFVARVYPQVKLLKNIHNNGFAGANNQAAGFASGTFIVALNPDTKVKEGWLEALLEPFQQPLNSAFLYGNKFPVGLTTPRILMLRAPEKINTCGNSVHFTGITICRGLFKLAKTDWSNQAVEVGAVSGACFAIKKELWAELGGFDESFFIYLEDTDLSIRARLAGYSILYVAKALIYHDYKATFSAQKIFYLERNRWLLLLKNLSLPFLIGSIPSLVVTEILSWGYLTGQGKPALSAKIQSYVWLWSSRSFILHLRKSVSTTRKISDRDLLEVMDRDLAVAQLGSPFVINFIQKVVNPIYRANHLILKSCLNR